MVFGGKKGKIWPPGQIDPKGTHPPPKHVFGCTERKCTLLRVSCGRTEGTKKKIKKAREGTTSPICPPNPSIFGGHHILHVGSVCGRNRTCQISSESFRGFGAPGGRKWPSSSELAHRPYNSVRTNVLHCDLPSQNGLTDFRQILHDSSSPQPKDIS